MLACLCAQISFRAAVSSCVQGTSASHTSRVLSESRTCGSKTDTFEWSLHAWTKAACRSRQPEVGHRLVNRSTCAIGPGVNCAHPRPARCVHDIFAHCVASMPSSQRWRSPLSKRTPAHAACGAAALVPTYRAVCPLVGGGHCHAGSRCRRHAAVHWLEPLSGPWRCGGEPAWGTPCGHTVWCGGRWVVGGASLVGGRLRGGGASL